VRSGKGVGRASSSFDNRDREQVIRRDVEDFPIKIGHIK